MNGVKDLEFTDGDRWPPPPSATTAPERSWRPIATAPKDGRSIILAVPGCRRGVLGRWHDVEQRQFGKVISREVGWAIDEGAHVPVSGDMPAPTHWRPLPRMPLVEESA